MKEFLKNFFIICVVVTAFLFVTFRSVETVWEPIQKTGGSGTQAVGESGSVLPGGGVEMAWAQEQTIYDMEVNGMTDAEKLALIDEMLADAMEHFWDTGDAQAWKAVAMCIGDVLGVGGVLNG